MCEVRDSCGTVSYHRDQLLLLLEADRRPQGAKGLALKSAYPPLELEGGDRLDPSPGLMDVHALAQVTMFPLPVVFWRQSRDTLCTHRCPLWQRELGLTPAGVLALDLLHTLFLGPMNCWCKFAMWALLTCGAWGGLEGTQAEQVRVAVLCCRHQLFAWCSRWERANPGKVLTRLSDLTVKMVGTVDEKKIKTKAMETYTLLLFLVDTLDHFRARLRDPEQLIEGGRCLIRYWELCKASPMHISEDIQAQLVALWNRHVTLIEPYGLSTPKHHLMVHVNDRALYHGNPAMYAVFVGRIPKQELEAVLPIVPPGQLRAHGLCKVPGSGGTRAEAR